MATESWALTASQGADKGLRGAGPCGDREGGFLEEEAAAGTAKGHTAGTQQGLNKCLLNLFSCSVRRLVALWAVVATPSPHPVAPRSLKVRALRVPRSGSDTEGWGREARAGCPQAGRDASDPRGWEPNLDSEQGW